MCSHVRGSALAAAAAAAAEAEAAAPFCVLLSLYMPQHTIDSADIYVNNFSCCRSSSSASSAKRFNNSSSSNNRKKSECIKCISVDVTMTLSPCFVPSLHYWWTPAGAYKRPKSVTPLTRRTLSSCSLHPPSSLPCKPSRAADKYNKIDLIFKEWITNKYINLIDKSCLLIEH